MSVNLDGTIFEDSQWWTAHVHARNAHDFMIGYINSIRQKQAVRYDNFRRLQNIYEWGYKATAATELSNLNSTNADVPLEDNVLSYNEVQGICQTLQAKICKTQIFPMPITTGGTYDQRDRAEKLGNAIAGEFEQNDVEGVTEDVVMEALINGTGWAKVFQSNGRVRVEHVPCDDVTVDDCEGRYRKPRSMFQSPCYDRFQLLAEYDVDDDALHGKREERRAAILRATNDNAKGESSSSHDQIRVHEGWHLPSKPVEYNENGEPEKHDGRHAICIDGCTLVDEPYDREVFPLLRYAPQPRRRSIWGLSLVHKLASGEREYEKVTAKIQQGHQLMGSTNIIAPETANVSSRKIANGQGQLWSYQGSVPPTTFNPDPINPATYAHQQSIPPTMSRMAGLSDMSVRSELPAGLQNASGKALQVYDDFESERLLPYSKKRERWTRDLAKLIVLECKAISESDPEYGVRYTNKKVIESINWKEVLMDEDDYVLQTYPTSMLARSAASKFAMLDAWLDKQIISPDEYRDMSEVPDLESANKLDLADVHIIDKMLAKMLKTGKLIEPQPFDRLDMAISRTNKFINMCRTDDEPEDKIDVIHEFVLSLISLKEDADMAMAAKAAPPPAPALPPMPPPMPMPAPIAPPPPMAA